MIDCISSKILVVGDRFSFSTEQDVANNNPPKIPNPLLIFIIYFSYFDREQGLVLHHYTSSFVYKF